MDSPLSSRQLNEEEWKGWKSDDSVFDNERRLFVLADSVVKLRPKRILDIGCGSGFLAGLIMKELPGIEIHGIDFSITALKRCKNTSQVYCVDIERSHIPFKDQAFDLIICSEVLEHLFGPEHVVAEIYRLLTIDGIGIITVPNFSFWRFRLQSLIGMVPNIVSHPGHFQVFNLELLQKLINKFSFRIVSMSGIHQRLHFVENIWPGFTCDTLVCKFKHEKG